MLKPACLAVRCHTAPSARYHNIYSSFSCSHPTQAFARSSQSFQTGLIRQRRCQHAQQRCRHCASQASKPKSSEPPPDNGTEERKSSNSEAGTSGIDKPASQKSGKPPNKQVALLMLNAQDCLALLLRHIRALAKFPARCARLL